MFLSPKKQSKSTKPTSLKKDDRRYNSGKPVHFRLHIDDLGNSPEQGVWAVHVDPFGKEDRYLIGTNVVCTATLHTEVSNHQPRAFLVGWGIVEQHGPDITITTHVTYAKIRARERESARKDNDRG